MSYFERWRELLNGSSVKDVANCLTACCTVIVTFVKASAPTITSVAAVVVVLYSVRISRTRLKREELELKKLKNECEGIILE